MLTDGRFVCSSSLRHTMQRQVSCHRISSCNSWCFSSDLSVALQNGRARASKSDAVAQWVAISESEPDAGSSIGVFRFVKEKPTGRRFVAVVSLNGQPHYARLALLAKGVGLRESSHRPGAYRCVRSAFSVSISLRSRVCSVWLTRAPCFRPCQDQYCD